MNFDKLHISNCSIEIVGSSTYTYFLNNLTVKPDWKIEEWELWDGTLQQQLGKTRLFFNLDWAFFETAIGAAAIGPMALVKKFLDLEEVNLIPDASQPTKKFQVLLDFPELGLLAEVNKGTLSKEFKLPLKTVSRLDAEDLLLFDFNPSPGSPDPVITELIDFNATDFNTQDFY